jgi:hypothetical protein
MNACMRRGLRFIVCIAFNCLWFARAGYAQPLVWSANGHYYEFVRTNVITWFDARAEAGTRSFAGLSGHLAIITSSAENDFITTSFGTGASANFAWLGGRAPNDQVDGLWQWDAGPEAGIQFSRYKTPTPPFNYANWGGIEPNHNQANENFLMMNLGLSFAGIGTGQWADAIPYPNPADPVVGYIVEYEPGPQPATNYLHIERVFDGYELSFFAETGRTYQIEFTADVGNPSWSNWGPLITGSGATVSLFDTQSSTVTSRFYRLKILP